MLHSIAASGRQYARVLLGGAQTDADALGRDFFDVSFKYHFVGHIVLGHVPLIEHNGVTRTEVGQTALFHALFRK